MEVDRVLFYDCWYGFVGVWSVVHIEKKMIRAFQHAHLVLMGLAAGLGGVQIEGFFIHQPQSDLQPPPLIHFLDKASLRCHHLRPT